MAGNDLKPTNDKIPQRFSGGDIFSAMRDEMDRVFGRFEHAWPKWPLALQGSGNGNLVMPQFDVHDNGKQLTIEAELPGVDEKDVNVTIANGVLTVKGEKKSEREENRKDYYMSERSYGSFERTLRLPDSIDDSKVDARFDKGVLKITAPMKPEAMKAVKKIEIKKS